MKLNKKTVMNWVFRKSGVLARIYGNVGKYKDLIAALPAYMQKKIITSRNCKRLIDPRRINPINIDCRKFIRIKQICCL